VNDTAQRAGSAAPAAVLPRRRVAPRWRTAAVLGCSRRRAGVLAAAGLGCSRRRVQRSVSWPMSLSAICTTICRATGTVHLGMLSGSSPAECQRSPGPPETAHLGAGWTRMAL